MKLKFTTPCRFNRRTEKTMKHSVRLAFLLPFLLAPLLSSPGQTADKAQGSSVTQKQFQSLIDEYYSAWNTGDPEKAAPLYAKDGDLVFYDITPLKYTGWAEYDKGVRNVLGSFASAKFTPNQDLRATRHGTIAWTTVTFHLSGKKKTGEAVEMDGGLGASRRALADCA
jgi:ketosteroid isomerase-like protein